MKRTTRVAAAATMAIGLAGSSHAYFDILGSLMTVPSYDSLGDPSNFDVVVDVAGGLGTPGKKLTLIGIGWDVELRTVDESWLSEAKMYVDDADAPGSPASFILTPGFAQNTPGVMSFSSPVVMLADVGLSDLDLSQGRLALEWFEGFDDVEDEVDAYWNGAIVLRFADIEVVPLPGAASLGLAGLGVVAGVRRRR